MRIPVSQLPAFNAEVAVTPQNEDTTIFRNWVGERNGKVKVYRSSQPNYSGKDTAPVFSRGIMRWLTSANLNIKLVISLNEFKLGGGGFAKFQLEKIKYLHVPVEDFGVCELKHLKEACELMDQALKAKNSVLVFCGYGQGRTGMMVTAHEIYDNIKNQKKKSLQTFLDASTAEEEVQEKLLIDLQKSLI
ncbi:protein-tyrosine phosphatase family protein [Pseudomonas sp. UFMG81]|jgi:protein tyrosine phosphatase|uniref:protein-tyrosine phosphatase family protein n=1 Tax=Pseudomonas sp. UFMG81 TaxID=2745936 RepID=UPI0018900E23|nr:dual specificity protein phosphatase [Pseudomonas sp. UFMG81]